MSEKLYTCRDDLPSVMKWPTASVRFINVEAKTLFGAKLCSIPSSNREGVRTIGIALETNEEGILTGLDDADGSLRFKLKHVDLLFHLDNPLSNVSTTICVKPSLRNQDDQWSAIVQARIYTAQNNQKFELVLADIFELSKRCSPLEFQLTPEIGAIKMEFRYIQQFYHKMPNFDEGDFSITFLPDDKRDLCVDRMALALYAPKLADLMNGIVPGVNVNFPVNVTREQLLEMLYQVYRTKRPLHTDFNALCAASTKLCNQLLLWPLCQEIIKDTQMNFSEKVIKAAELGLDDAVLELCYDAVKTGEWKSLQEVGFDARKIFGQDIFCRLVCPAIIEAIKDQSNVQQPSLMAALYSQKHPRPQPCFDSLYEAANPLNVHLLVNGKMFYVNRGVLHISGCLQKMTCDGTSPIIYSPIVSPNLKHELESRQLKLEQVVVPLLHLLYGTIKRVENYLVRACLIFAYDHGMHTIVEDFEELLLHEPIDGPEILLDHFLLAEKYNLVNLARKSLWQLEMEEHQHFGLRMIELPEYRQLSPLLEVNIEDRICAGWAVFNKNLAKRQPTDLTTYLLKGQGPAIPIPKSNVDLHELATVVMVGEDSFEKFTDYQKDIGDDTAVEGTIELDALAKVLVF